ncbi:MAG: hypothetical protein LBF49_00835, partial [Puniceicoccales bacterium]|nr:hypothetical protein [Puniceicoccales bacterium]
MSEVSSINLKTEIPSADNPSDDTSMDIQVAARTSGMFTSAKTFLRENVPGLSKRVVQTVKDLAVSLAKGLFQYRHWIVGLILAGVISGIMGAGIMLLVKVVTETATIQVDEVENQIPIPGTEETREVIEKTIQTVTGASVSFTPVGVALTIAGIMIAAISIIILYSRYRNAQSDAAEQARKAAVELEEARSQTEAIRREAEETSQRALVTEAEKGEFQRKLNDT